MKNFVQKMASERVYPWETPFFLQKFPNSLPLYQPLWYMWVLKKKWKKCTFWYPFSRKFFTWPKFRSKPRLKKIMTGGGVVQVGQKRAPQGLFYRNLHPPLD